jgi:hypothetical protein
VCVRVHVVRVHAHMPVYTCMINTVQTHAQHYGASNILPRNLSLSLSLSLCLSVCLSLSLPLLL